MPFVHLGLPAISNSQKPSTASIKLDVAHVSPFVKLVRSCGRQKSCATKNAVRSQRILKNRAAALDSPAAREEQIDTEHEYGSLDTSEQEEFVWMKNWYPVAVVDFLRKDKPTAISLLNEELVLWHGEDGLWHAAIDECPHKLAPLSEGRVQDGVLECRYHAWKFSVDGRCSFNPQSGERTGEGSLRSSRTCLKSFPTQVVQGLLWVWPEAGADGQLASLQKQPRVYPEAERGAEWMGAKRQFEFLEAGVNWSLMVENAMDPSHAPSLHEDALGPRSEMVPMDMSVEKIHPTEGVQVSHGGYKSSQVKQGMEASRTFIPPHTVRTAYTMANGLKVNAVLYLVPSRPGHSLAFVKFMSRLPESLGGSGQKLTQRLRSLPKVLRMLPKGILKLFIPAAALEHSLNHGIQDQDHLMLHHAERRMALGSDKTTLPLDWKKYTLASRADAGVSAFWRWMDAYSSGDVGWAHGATSADMEAKKDRQKLFDHYERHTKHCAACQLAVERIDTMQRWLVVLGALFAAAAVIFSPPLSLRATAVAAVGLLWFCHQKLAELRYNFFAADKLPDE